MGSNYFHRFIAVTLLFALLLVSGGRAICVSALAQPDWTINAEYAPIFDTEIINIEDYMGSHLTTSQYDVFWLLMGVYVLAQGGSEEYKLRNPYANETGVVNWLKDCGIQLWNTMVGLNMTPIDPVTGVDWKVLAKKAQDIAMGAAVKASTYDDLDDFLDDVEAKDKYLVPFMPDVQTALNYAFMRNGGLYNWQFENTDFVTSLEYDAAVIPPTNSYWNLLLSFHDPLVRLNYLPWQKNAILNSDFFDRYTNFFLNTTDGKYYFVDDEGNFSDVTYTNPNITCRYLYYYTSDSVGTVGTLGVQKPVPGAYPSLSSWQDIIQYYVDNPNTIFNLTVFLNDFIKHYYHGNSWANRIEIFNTTDLNFDENSLPYYQQITNDYLLDIKGIIQDLINNTDLTNVFLDNLFDLEGVIVTDPQLIQVTKDILYEIQTQNIPIPVNLNEVSELTENTYMDLVKERATAAGHTLAELVAFWHNCDAEIIYALFGAGLTVLVGAFIGKWGHS